MIVTALPLQRAKLGDASAQALLALELALPTRPNATHRTRRGPEVRAPFSEIAFNLPDAARLTSLRQPYSTASTRL